MTNIDNYHALAKDAGNKLRAYILSVASGGTAVFFVALTNAKADTLTLPEKWMLFIALMSFVLTIALSLYELRIDAQRFFKLAKELEKPEQTQDWRTNERYKRKRYILIHSTYFTLGIGVLCTSVYLILKIISS